MKQATKRTIAKPDPDAETSPTKRRGALKPWDNEDLEVLWGAIYEVAKRNVAEFAGLPHFKDKGRTNSAIHMKLKAMFKDKVKNIK